MTEQTNDLDKPIGTKDAQTLAPSPVDIVKVEFKQVESKEGKKFGRKLVFSVKHPDKAELIEISEAKLIDGDKMTLATLWENLDEDGNIRKGSHLAKVMTFFGCKIPRDFEGRKGVQTVQKAENNKYLALKAYN